MKPSPPCPFPKLFPDALLRDDAYFMALAYNRAIDAWQNNEVPVGAVIEHGGHAIAAAHNRVETLKDPTAHAEMLAITQAAQVLGDWRLNEATLYVTKEPCPMCSGAAILARLQRVVFAIPDPKMGFLGGVLPAHTIPSLNHTITITPGVLERECKALLQKFFQLKRDLPDPASPACE